MARGFQISTTILPYLEAARDLRSPVSNPGLWNGLQPSSTLGYRLLLNRSFSISRSVNVVRFGEK
jgi:hypothetical protein